MVPSYRGPPCFFCWLVGLVQSFLPSDKSMKFCTPVGALSGSNLQFNLPAVVSMRADMSAADFATVGFEDRLAAGGVDFVCDHRDTVSRHSKIVIPFSVRMKAPE